MQRGKICFFVPFYPLITGGAEYQAKLIALALQKEGFTIVYVSSGHEHEKCETIDGFKVYQLKVSASLSDKMSLYSTFIKKVGKIIRDEAPNMLYQRMLNTFTYRFSNLAKNLKIPFVLHIADNYSIEFGTGTKDLLKRKLFKRILKKNPIIICQTEYQRSKIRDFKYEPTAVIPNMHPSICSSVPTKDKKRIVWIGNARPVKQLEVYLELAECLSDSDYEFHVIGKLPDNNYGKWLQEKVVANRNIEYHGIQNNDFVNSFLSRSALLINTSVSEGFSNTFIQAWMCGTPVLALNSDPGGIIKTNKIGLNCNGDKSMLANSIEEILESPTYGTLCERSLETANSFFAIEKNIPKFITILEEAKHDRKKP
ncbi:glycosyltransferase family 4 protein [Maribacter sp. 2-571]|uniref:glycosyltransferase family 4 protein n=1 Tax=Maribacter sp. 2-571 TaxID=3417569 RepID=UPI003D33B2E8